MTEQLTHWKKLTNPNYIGAYSLEPGQDMTLTIKTVAKQMIKGTDGKEEEAMIITFTENVKPMICNKTNAKTIAKLHKSPYIEQWAGKQIQIFATPVTAFGSTTDALRIRDFLPKSESIDTTHAIASLKKCTTLEQLKATFLSLSKAEQSDKSVKSLVEKMKGEMG